MRALTIYFNDCTNSENTLGAPLMNMKAKFKQLGLVAAVAAVSAGYVGVASAQSERAIGNLGDLAIVPYYTVQDGWQTGVHIINSSTKTQVVKLRLRRASDSADALDFNLIMSPKDEWTGSLSMNAAGTITFSTDDNTCTAPIRSNGVFEMPDIYRLGAEEGYIEVIGMGQPTGDEGAGTPAPTDTNGTSAIAWNAKHVAGVPRNCSAVASNFFANGVTGSVEGVVDNANTVGTHVPNSSTDVQLVDDDEYTDADNVLKVSYFMRDAASGIEFGGDAVHIANFSDSGQAFMTNQETGLFSGDVEGFDYPDLDGGPVAAVNLRGKFNELRAFDVLGVLEVLNDWSIASARNVSTDWVVTMPGQYTMVDTYVWLTSGLGAGCGTIDNPSTAVDETIPECDFRDLPVQADLTLWDREEAGIVPESGDLVISPAPPGTTNTLIFPNEVNVVEWTDGVNTPVLGSDYQITVDASVLGDFGWAELAVSSLNANGNSVCSFDSTSGNRGTFESPAWDTDSASDRSSVCGSATGAVPVVGFVAWERSFPQNPDGNYGRLIDHSFVQSD
jgi:hypothetical protein